MSTPAEVLQKPKRKYTRHAKPDIAPVPTPETPSPELAHIPSSEAPAHSMPCCVVMGSYIEKSELNEEMLRKYTRCGKESSWVPRIKFKGRHFVVRKDDEGNNIQVRSGKMWPVDVIWQPVCEMHKKLIEKDASIIYSSQWLNSQISSLVKNGFPTPEPELTRIVWTKYVYEEPEPQNDILDALQRVASERATLNHEGGFSHIPQEDA